MKLITLNPTDRGTESAAGINQSQSLTYAGMVRQLLRWLIFTKVGALTSTVPRLVMTQNIPLISTEP